MIFFICSLSQKQALSYVRTVLDCWGRRCGAESWFVKTNREGISIIRDTLSEFPKSKMREMAVACYRVDGFSHKKIGLQWLIGNSLRLKSQGLVPIRSSNVRRVSDKQTLFMSETVRLSYDAGVGHDPGKATSHFQSKLKKEAPVSDPIRHEAISVEALRGAAKGLSVADAIQGAVKRLGRYILNEGQFPGPLSMFERLILSHHRLPSRGLQTANHIREVPECAAKLAKTEKAVAGVGDELWSELRDIARTRRDERTGQDSVSSKDVPRASFFYARMGLMLADHYVSSLSCNEGGEVSDAVGPVAPWLSRALRPTGRRNVVKANSWQPLDGHLRSVGRCARMLSRALIRGRLVADLPTLAEGQLAHIPGRQGKFAWQGQSIDFVLDQVSPGDTCLMFVGSATGSGKTRFCAVAASTLAWQRPRWTTVLNLRTLTLQTGDEYNRDLGLSSGELAVHLGSREVIALHRAYSGSQEPAPYEDDAEPELIEYEVQGGNRARVNRYISSQCQLISKGKGVRISSRKMAYISTPVLVTTIDSLIQAADHRRSRWLLPALRLLSGPLIIDEIDQYDPKDLVPVLRLIYLAGLVGQSVICSSATIYPAIGLAINAAFCAGWAEHRVFFGKNPPRLKRILVSDVQPPCLASGEGIEFSRECMAYNEAIFKAEMYCKARMGSFIDVTLKDARVTAFEKITSGAIEFHCTNHVLVDGLRFSVGAIRLTYIKDIAAYTSYLSQQKIPGVEFRIVCLHANFPLAVRGHIERRLSEMLNRSKCPLSPIKDKDVSKLCEKARSQGVQDVMVVVVMSTAGETGANYDFDWGIADPHSGRSAVQFAGRIMRHRTSHKAALPNVALLRYPLRVLRGGDSLKNFSKRMYFEPGFEARARPLPDHDMANIAPWIRGIISSEPCTVPKKEESILTWYEDEAIAASLGEDFFEPYIRNTDAFFDSGHYDKFRFRGNKRQFAIYYDPRDNAWKSEAGPVTKMFASDSFIVDPGMFLFDMNYETIAEELAERLNTVVDDRFLQKYFSVQLPIKDDTQSRPTTMWNKYLGIYDK